MIASLASFFAIELVFCIVITTVNHGLLRVCCLHNFWTFDMRGEVFLKDFDQEMAVAIKIRTDTSTDDDYIRLDSRDDDEKSAAHTCRDAAPDAWTFDITSEFVVDFDDRATTRELFPDHDFATIFERDMPDFAESQAFVELAIHRETRADSSADRDVERRNRYRWEAACLAETCEFGIVFDVDGDAGQEIFEAFAEINMAPWEVAAPFDNAIVDDARDGENDHRDVFSAVVRAYGCFELGDVFVRVVRGRKLDR